MSELHRRLDDLRRRIETAAARAGRRSDEIQLLAVSKGFPTDAIREAAALGLRCFGENRVQEAEAKIDTLGREKYGWELIGSLQRNKARKAAALFDVVQSVDRIELAEALDRGAGESGRELSIYLQVNIDDEAQKTGTNEESVHHLLAKIDQLPHLRPLGLMAIPQQSEDPATQRASFQRLRELLERTHQNRDAQARLQGLSMGMSSDFEIAIEEGATCVRVGSALFGSRPERGTIDE